MASRSYDGLAFADVRQDCWEGQPGHEGCGEMSHRWAFELERDWYRWWGMDIAWRAQSGPQMGTQVYIDAELLPLVGFGVGYRNGFGLHLQLGPLHLFLGHTL